jgi:hypothetical protein
MQEPRVGVYLYFSRYAHSWRRVPTSHRRSRARGGLPPRSQHRSVIWSLPGLVAEASTHELQPLFPVGHGLLACSRVGMYLYRAAPMFPLYAPPPSDPLCRAHRARAARAFDQIRQVRRVKELRPNKESVNMSVNWLGVK